MAWEQRDLFIGIVTEFAERQQRWGEREEIPALAATGRRHAVVLAAQARWRAKNRQKARDDWHAKYGPNAKGRAA